MPIFRRSRWHLRNVLRAVKGRQNIVSMKRRIGAIGAHNNADFDVMRFLLLEAPSQKKITEQYIRIKLASIHKRIGRKYHK